MEVLTISARAVGRRKPLIPDWQIPWHDEEGGDDGVTLRKLITRIVHEEVQAFERRQEERKLIRVLTEREMGAGLEKGRVDSGGRDLHPRVEADEAVAVALQAFEDGLYLVFVDDQEHRSLESQIYLHNESRVIFIRLTLLSGA